MEVRKDGREWKEGRGLEKLPMGMADRAAVGIDFGTTNSSVALAAGGPNVTLARFQHERGATEAYRSLLYLEHLKQHGRSSIKSWTGPVAIEQYLAAETKGRLIQSLKSYLTSRTLTTTDVFGRRHSLEDLIARILIDLREQAEQQLGIRIRHAMVGRPVRYVGAETEDDNQFAISRLRKAFEIAGYESVDFEMEPVAAAYYYESTLDHDELVLIGDFGGGTSDFSLLAVGPRRRAHGTNAAASSETTASDCRRRVRRRIVRNLVRRNWGRAPCRRS